MARFFLTVDRCQSVAIDGEVFSHGCQILKTPNFSRSTFENFQKRKFPFWEFPTVVNLLKTPIFQETIFKKFPFLENSHGCQKGKGSQKIRKIPKIIKKFPHSLERAENAENAWEIYGKSWENSEINSQKF